MTTKSTCCETCGYSKDTYGAKAKRYKICGIRRRLTPKDHVCGNYRRKDEHNDKA